MIVPLVLVIIAFALYPQAALTASEPATKASIAGGGEMKGPHIDWAAISPLVALTVGACLVLMAGLLRPAFVRTTLVPGLTIVTLGVAVGLGVWQWNENEVVVAGALAIDDLTLALMMVFVAGALAATLLSTRSLAAAEAGHGEYHALLLVSVLGMVVLAGATNLVTLFIGFELLSIPLYVLCATELRREHSLESGLKYLIIGSLGSAVLLYGLALLYGATGSTDFARDRREGGRRRGRHAVRGRDRADRHRARVQGVGGAVPPVDARRLRGRADADHRVHGGGDEGGRVRGADPAVRHRADQRPPTCGRRPSRRSRW